ncbi:hypothetical protein [Streptomyces werraensis]|uniref:hypothetical protein n=1 Tax=Streptomyces werraensis TaxID=68284 RepID=UPI003803230C
MSTDLIDAAAVPHTARLVATVLAPLGAVDADAPRIQYGPGHRLLVQRGDDELAMVGLGPTGQEHGAEFRFPAPWPRPFGDVTVSPAGDLAVFSGVHAVRAVDRTGKVHWELPHGCWSAAKCMAAHASFEEYADDPRHRHADRGSAAFSPDGKLVWAHVRHAQDWPHEEWLVLDAADGSVLGRTRTSTVGSASAHFPHPDGSYMGLTVGEGHEDSPSLWGHWNGTDLSFERIEGVLLQDVSPSGGHFLCTDPGQWALYLHESAGAQAIGHLNARDVAPPAPGKDMARWDYEGAYPYEDGAVISTDGHTTEPRHWLVNLGTLALRGRIVYSLPIPGSPLPAGPGLWATLAEDRAAVHLWSLTDAS